MVTVTSVTDPMTARILAARLGSEGIVWQIRGGDGVYPLGPVELMVEEDDADTARALLGDAAGEEVVWLAGASSARRRRVVIAAVLVALLMTLTFGRFVIEAASEPSPPGAEPSRNG